jgi:hypothetical protein
MKSVEMSTFSFDILVQIRLWSKVWFFIFGTVASYSVPTSVNLSRETDHHDWGALVLLLSPSRQIPEVVQYLIFGHSHILPHPFHVYWLYAALDAVSSELLIVSWMSCRNSFRHWDLKPGLSSLWRVTIHTTLSWCIIKWYANNKNVWYRWNCNLIVFQHLRF